jgi:hypothetical protein
MTIFFFGEGPRSRCYGRIAALRLVIQPCDEDDNFFFFFPSNGAPVKWNWQVKTCPSATLSTGDRNPGLRGERLATNRLRHGTALYAYLHWSTLSFHYAYYCTTIIVLLFQAFLLSPIIFLVSYPVPRYRPIRPASYTLPTCNLISNPQSLNHTVHHSTSH